MTRVRILWRQAGRVSVAALLLAFAASPSFAPPFARPAPRPSFRPGGSSGGFRGGRVVEGHGAERGRLPEGHWGSAESGIREPASELMEHRAALGLGSEAFAREPYWKSPLEREYRMLQVEEAVARAAPDEVRSDVAPLVEAFLLEQAEQIAYRLRSEVGPEVATRMISSERSLGDPLSELSPEYPFSWPRSESLREAIRRTRDSLRERSREERDRMVDLVQTTGTAWQRLKSDILELERRSNQAEEARWAKAAKERRGNRLFVRLHPLAHRRHRSPWLRWSGVLLSLDAAQTDRLLALPREARRLALDRLSSELGRVPGDPARAAERTIRKVETAVHALAGDAFPDLAEAISQQLGGRLLTVSARKSAQHRLVRVRRGAKQRAVSVRVPRWELFGLERDVVRRRFESAVGPADPREPVLFVGGDQDFTSRELLPTHFTARTFDGSLRFADRHLANLHGLSERKLDPEKVTFFNGVPGTAEEVTAFASGGSVRTWKRFRDTFESVAEAARAQRPKPTRDDLLTTLRAGEQDVIVVVAHGASDALYLSPTEKVTLDDILDLPGREGKPAPLVMLIACESGLAQKGSQAIAQALLMRGYASAVVAPTRRIEPRQELADFVRDVLSGRELSAVLRARPKDVELWVRREPGFPWDAGLYRKEDREL